MADDQDRDINYNLRATDSTGKGFASAKREAEGFFAWLKKENREASASGEKAFEKMAGKGLEGVAGAFGNYLKVGAGVTVASIVGDKIREFSASALEIRNQLAEGKLTTGGEVADSLLSKIPVFGGFWEAGRSLHELAFGEKLADRRDAEENELDAKLTEARNRMFTSMRDDRERMQEQVYRSAGTERISALFNQPYQQQIAKLDEDKSLNERMAETARTDLRRKMIENAKPIREIFEKQISLANESQERFENAKKSMRYAVDDFGRPVADFSEDIQDAGGLRAKAMRGLEDFDKRFEEHIDSVTRGINADFENKAKTNENQRAELHKRIADSIFAETGSLAGQVGALGPANLPIRRSLYEISQEAFAHQLKEKIAAMGPQGSNFKAMAEQYQKLANSPEAMQMAVGGGPASLSLPSADGLPTGYTGLSDSAQAVAATRNDNSQLQQQMVNLLQQILNALHQPEAKDTFKQHWNLWNWKYDN